MGKYGSCYDPGAQIPWGSGYRTCSPQGYNGSLTTGWSSVVSMYIQ